MVYEQYSSGSRTKKLSASDLRKMKENMQKISTIKAKEKKYWIQEDWKIENLMQDLENIPSPQIQTSSDLVQENVSPGMWQKIKNFLFK